MSRARRLAGLPPPKDDLIIKSNSSIPSSLSKSIKKIVVPKNIKSSRKLSRIEPKISFTSKVAPLNKKEFMKSQEEMDFDNEVEEVVKSSNNESSKDVREQEMEQKGDKGNLMNFDDVNDKSNKIEQSTSSLLIPSPEVTSQMQRKPIFQVPITSASKFLFKN